MKHVFYLEDEIKIIERFGDDFYKRVQSLIDPLTLKWNIIDIQLIKSFSSNLVFKCVSISHGYVVLKFGNNSYEFRSEINALKHFNNDCVSTLIDYDFDNNVLMAECLQPGTELSSVEELEIRLEVFCGLFRALHKTDIKVNENIVEYNYKSYCDWIMKVANYMENQESWKDISLHMKRAKDLFIDLSERFESQSILHGDLHYYNILQSDNDYKVIDPKGVIGDPVFDIPRYILNEFWDESDKLKVDGKIETVFNIISDELCVSKGVLAELLYVEGTMAICWIIEDGAKISEKENYSRMLDSLYGYVIKYRDNSI